jgi:hypothetical protein
MMKLATTAVRIRCAAASVGTTVKSPIFQPSFQLEYGGGCRKFSFSGQFWRKDAEDGNVHFQ